MPKIPSKYLILRLSSLGDVILATSSLQHINADWAVASNYAEVLRGHPRIDQLLEYDRKSGLRGWVKFCRTAWENNYFQIYDLHGSLRTRLMRMLFIVWSITSANRGKVPAWKVISKQKFRLWGYCSFKALWPRTWRPIPWVQHFARAVAGTGNERPDLTHLLTNSTLSSEVLIELPNALPPRYICVMPSSKWDSKRWPTAYYVKLLKKHQIFPVILGASHDRASVELCNQLEKSGVAHFSGVGKWNLRQTAVILSKSSGYLGTDTGLAHLAEAVGVPAKVIFGPTVPDLGFGPWREKSQSFGIFLSCRPCSRNGKYCYRLGQQYECLNGLSVEEVESQLKDY